MSGLACGARGVGDGQEDLSCPDVLGTDVGEPLESLARRLVLVILDHKFLRMWTEPVT